MRFAIAALMMLHGVAHVVGFAGAWQIAPEGFPYRTKILNGRVDLGDVGARVLGLLWLALAIAFIFAAVLAVGAVAWWPVAALGVATVSLLLSLVEFPEARLGVVINAMIIAALLLGRWLGRV